jgi:hypothetical protein
MRRCEGLQPTNNLHRQRDYQRDWIVAVSMQIVNQNHQTLITDGPLPCHSCVKQQVEHTAAIAAAANSTAAAAH